MPSKKMKRKNKVNNQRGGDGNHNIQSVGMPSKYFTDKTVGYYPKGSEQLKVENGAYGNTVANSFGVFDNSKLCANNAYTSPNLAPFPSSGLQTGGKKNKKKSLKKKKQKGGDGNHNIQSVGMPGKYFTNKTDGYFPKGSEQLKVENGAYGKTVAHSFGVFDNNKNCSETSPNLAPYPSSGIQTGGKSKKKNKKSI